MSLNTQKIGELLPYLQPDLLNSSTTKAVQRVDKWLQWFTKTRPTFTDKEAQDLLYGDTTNVGVMQACGLLKATSRRKEKTRRRRRDKHIKFLSEIIGLVETSPTHPAYNCNSNCGSSLTRACVNAPVQILLDMCLQEVLCQQFHYDDPDVHFRSCQLVHTIVYLRDASKKIALPFLLSEDKIAMESYMSWHNNVIKPGDNLADINRNAIQMDSAIHEHTLKTWSQLPIVNGFNPLTGEGDGGVGLVIDRLLRPFMTPAMNAHLDDFPEEGTAESKEQKRRAGRRQRRGAFKDSAIETAMNAVFSRTDELGRNQGKKLGYHRDQVGQELGVRKGGEGGQRRGERERETTHRKTSSNTQDDSHLFALVRGHFTSFVKAHRMCGSILSFLTSMPDNAADDDGPSASVSSFLPAHPNFRPSSRSSTSTSTSTSTITTSSAISPFLQSTSATLQKLNQCVETHFIPVITQQESAANISHSVDLLQFLDPITTFSSVVRELLLEEDYDSCVIEFENAVEFVKSIPPEFVSTVDERSSSVSIQLYRVLDNVFQTLRRNMSEHAGRTDIPVATREHLVALYRILYFAFETLQSFTLPSATLPTIYNVQSFVVRMFKQFENDSIDRFESSFQTATLCYNAKSLAWDGTNALQVCRRVVDEIFEHFKILRTSDILMNAFDRREDRAATKNNICGHLVADMICHMTSLVETWRQVGAEKDEWFDVLCDVFITFHDVEHYVQNHVGNYDVAVANSIQDWMKKRSHDIIERCNQRIEINLKHLDITSIRKDILRMKQSFVKYDTSSLQSMKTCLNRCIQKKTKHILQSFNTNADNTVAETKDDSQHRRRQDEQHSEQCHNDPLQAAVTQLGVWHSFEHVILDVLTAVHQDLEEVDRFRIQVKAALSEGSAALVEGVVVLYEIMLKQKLQANDGNLMPSFATVASASTSTSLLSFEEHDMFDEILVDIVCLKNDLIQHEWNDVDSVVHRLLTTVGMLPGSPARMDLESDPSCKMLLRALVPSQ